MGEAISSLYNELSSLLNPSAISVDSIEGFILMLLFLCCVYSLWHKAVKAVGWCICGIVIFQCLYSLSLTGFNDIIPLSTFFKYDVITSIAQCFKGTPVCDVLLWFDAFLIVVFSDLWKFAGNFFTSVWHLILQLFNFAKAIPNKG